MRPAKYYIIKIEERPNCTRCSLISIKPIHMDPYMTSIALELPLSRCCIKFLISSSFTSVSPILRILNFIFSTKYDFLSLWYDFNLPQNCAIHYNMISDQKMIRKKIYYIKPINDTQPHEHMWSQDDRDTTTQEHLSNVIQFGITSFHPFFIFRTLHYIYKKLDFLKIWYDISRFFRNYS